ncbi:MAG: acetyl-CoA carboxylase biotin carboxyl carrier protein [bacterium]
MKYSDIKRLVKLVEGSNIAELEVEFEGSKVRIAKIHQSGDHLTPPLYLNYPPSSEYSPTPSRMSPHPIITIGESESRRVDVSEERELVRKAIEVQSPMVGTFYRAPSPEAPPYVEVGDIVRPGQVLCIIEAMKIMNEIEAEVAGKILEICVENAQPVEFGQILFRIEPL